jgi:hypothetical protein
MLPSYMETIFKSQEHYIFIRYMNFIPNIVKIMIPQKLK